MECGSSIYDKIKEEVVALETDLELNLFTTVSKTIKFIFSEIKQFQIDKKLSLNKKVLIDYLFSGRILDKRKLFMKVYISFLQVIIL